jgi:flagellar hook-associated protein 1 FlgK
MSSSLFSIGTSALLANQQALATTGHNISNANTEGYSRQRVDFTALHVAGQSSGGGVEANAIQRYSDPYASARLTQSTADFAALDTGATLARRLDSLLSNADTGLAQPLREFSSAVDAWAANPSAIETRVELVGDAEALAQRFSQLQNSIDDISVELNSRISGSVDEINNLSRAIAQLNDEIAVSSGVSTPNDLLDQRDRLVSNLSKQIDVSTAEQDDGSVNVYVANGQALVVGKQVQNLQAVPGATPDEPHRVVIGGGDVSAQITGGELGGILRFRSGVMEPAQQNLSALAQAMTTAVNGVQANGTTPSGAAGQAIFGNTPPSATLTLLNNDPDSWAAAASGAAANSGDNTNALALGDVLKAPLIGQSSAQELNVALVGRVGSQARSLDASASAQATLVAQHQQLRDQVSGVNLDEEAADLLRFQQAYQAAAQIISTADEMFQTLLAATR